MDYSERRSKTALLKKHGYDFDFQRLSYVNRETRKVFSLEFVDDHTEGEIVPLIDEPSSSSGWRFYFNSPPTDVFRPLLEQEYEELAGVRS